MFHEIIGDFTTTLRTLLKGKGESNVCPLINHKKKAKKKSYKDSGNIHLISSSLRKIYSFLDYIKGGTQLNCTIAIDFTASNGNPMSPGTLHYLDPYHPNQYASALQAVGEIIQDYDSDKPISYKWCEKTYKNNFTQRANENKYQRTGKNGHPSSPFCEGIKGVMEAYQACLRRVQLYGPTNFSPIINHVARSPISSQCLKTNYKALSAFLNSETGQTYIDNISNSLESMEGLIRGLYDLLEDHLVVTRNLKAYSPLIDKPDWFDRDCLNMSKMLQELARQIKCSNEKSARCTLLADFKSLKNSFENLKTLKKEHYVQLCVDRLFKLHPGNSKFWFAHAAQDGSQYFILLILTDGIISDMAQTKEAIVNASSLPLSIIIVGVGNVDFEAMEELDGDDQRLSYNGRLAVRDIVQFVPFRKFISSNSMNFQRSQALLAKEVLAEIPYQIISFMKSKNIVPNPPCSHAMPSPPNYEK
ncbi:Copine-8 [Nymphon striatum]|nr:Copine-8 [Nymphon striatum]